MTEFIITRGLPASGKTTYALAWVAQDFLHRARVNRDDLRASVFGDGGPGYYACSKEDLYSKEKAVTVAQHAAIKALLGRGVSVICDDTNLPVRRVRDLRQLAPAGVKVTIDDSFAGVPLGVCIARNTARENPVPQMTIHKMHMRYINGGLAPVLDEPEATDGGRVPVDHSLPIDSAFLFDIDGTLANMGTRSPYDESRVHEDVVIEPVAEMARNLRELGYPIIVMSGRTAGCREATRRWLVKNLIPFDALYMRGVDDKRKDADVKYDLFDNFVRDRYNVRGVFDDRDSVVAMWREIGLTCYQVNYGDF